MSSFSSSSLISFHVSHLYSKTDKTRLLKREASVFLLMSVARQMLLGFLNDALASAVPFLMSAVLPPSLVTLAPRYVKVSTSSTSLFPAVKFSSLLLLVLRVLQLFPGQLLLRCLQVCLFSIVGGSGLMTGGLCRPRNRGPRVVVKFHRIPVLSP